MKSRITKLGGAMLLSAVLSASAFAQSLTNPSTQQIQNVTHTLEKAAIISAGAGLAVTVIGLAIRAHHHKAKTSKLEDYKGQAQQSARLSGPAETHAVSTAADTTTLSPAKPADQAPETRFSANPTFQVPAGFWTWQQVVGSSQ